MKGELPEGLARYFDAQNRHDIEAMVGAFAPEARVRDEGRDIVGTEAIREWKQETSARYRVTVRPDRAERIGDEVAVGATVSGSFPGSPLAMTYRFRLDGAGRIAALSVTA